tara:strand:- start:624 stop:797 length:174 start_codon:yes stop_codon:yes gene_type:complete
VRRIAMKIGDLVVDPTGFHRGIGVIKGARWPDLWVWWLLENYCSGASIGDVVKHEAR